VPLGTGTGLSERRAQGLTPLEPAGMPFEPAGMLQPMGSTRVSKHKLLTRIESGLGLPEVTPKRVKPTNSSWAHQESVEDDGNSVRSEVHMTGATDNKGEEEEEEKEEEEEEGGEEEEGNGTRHILGTLGNTGLSLHSDPDAGSIRSGRSNRGNSPPRMQQAAPNYERGHRPSLMVSDAAGFGKRISINYLGNQRKRPFKPAKTSRCEIYDKRMFPRMTQIYQKVYQTFMIKSIRNVAEGDFDMVMVGTVIQRVIDDPRIVRDENNNIYRFVYDLNDEDKAICGAPKLLCEENPMSRPFFTYRINEIYHDVTDNIRKVTIVGCNDSKGVVPCSVTNMSVEFPCTMHSAFNGKPYQILTCECLIELTSRYCGDHEYRPNLMANKTGMDNICCVRDENNVDELYAYDPMWPFPTIEIPNEGKMKNGELVNYTPKMMVYFYMTTSPMDTFIRTFLPILFATVAQTMNCMHDVRTRYGSCEWYVGDEGDIEAEQVPDGGGWFRRKYNGNLVRCVQSVPFYGRGGRDVSYEAPNEYDSRSEFLQVTVSIGLAVIFILPQISDDAMSNEHIITMNEIYIMIFFTGLIVGCIDGYETEYFSFISMWLSLFIPLSSMLRYQLAKGYILSNSVDKLKRGVSSKNTKAVQAASHAKLMAARAASKDDERSSRGAKKPDEDEGSGRSSIGSNVMNKSGADVDGNDLCEFFTPGIDGKNVVVNKAIVTEDMFPSATGMFHDNQLWFSMGHRKDAMSEDAKASKIRSDTAKALREKTNTFIHISPGSRYSSGRFARISTGLMSPQSKSQESLNL